MRKFISLVPVLFLSFALFANPTLSTAANKPAEYTMLIYLNGCDLEGRGGEATEALEILQKSDFDDSKLNIIAVTGGTTQWKMTNPAISTTHVQAWRISGAIPAGDKNVHTRMELVKETPPSVFMMDKETLSEYLSWTIKNYPAKKYVLIMWNHGAGPIGGFGTDELNNNKSLSISEIREALKAGLNSNKLELLAFTCCLMGNFETAYQLKDCANYMVASEELEYGDAFGETINALRNKPSMSGKELGKIFIDSHFKGVFNGRLYTFSLIDMSKVGEIRERLDALAMKLSEIMKTKGYCSVSRSQIDRISFNCCQY